MYFYLTVQERKFLTVGSVFSIPQIALLHIYLCQTMTRRKKQICVETQMRIMQCQYTTDNKPCVMT